MKVSGPQEFLLQASFHITAQRQLIVKVILQTRKYETKIVYTNKYAQTVHLKLPEVMLHFMLYIEHWR